MIENIKTVTNPLTIIAIFAGLAEVAGTVAIFGLESEPQTIFIWFVMAFPLVLVILFFVTLNFNPKVLYAPSDFKDEKNFMHAVIRNGFVSNERVEITKEIIQGKAPIPIPASGPGSESEGTHNLPSLFTKEQSFLDTFFKKIEPHFDSGIIKGLKMSAPSNEFYLLGVEFNKDKVSAKKANEFDFLIRQKLNGKKRIEYEVVGHKIVSEDLNEFVELFAKSIEEIWSQIKKDSELGQKEKSSLEKRASKSALGA